MFASSFAKVKYASNLLIPTFRFGNKLAAPAKLFVRIMLARRAPAALTRW